MKDYVYEEINIGGERRNVSLGLFMNTEVHKEDRIEVYDSDAFGRCLYLDGALQCSEADEYIYHETLVHTALLKLTPKNVLIIGGGDGGSLREVLKHQRRGLRKVVFCEINPRVIEVCKEHFPITNLKENLTDPIVEVVNMDGAKYVEQGMGYHKFDAILVDCPDPSVESVSLYSPDFFRHAKSCLAPGGIFAIQAGNVFIKEKHVRSLRYDMSKFWSNVQYHYCPVPSFPSGGIGFLFATTNPLSGAPSGTDNIETRYLTSQTMLCARGIRPKSFNENKRWEKFNEYCKHVFDFKQSRTKGDIVAMNAMFALEDEPDMDPQHALFEFGQTISGDIKLHYMTLRTFDNVDKIQGALRELLHERNIEVDHDSLYNGVTFYSDGSFGLHTIGKEKPANFPDIPGKPDICFDEAEYTTIYDHGVKLCRATYSDLGRDYARYPKPMFNCDVNKVRTNKEYWYKLVCDEGRKSIDKLGKMGMILSAVEWRHRALYGLRFKVADCP